MPETPDLEEQGGFCSLLSRLFLRPPDKTTLEDVQALGWVPEGQGLQPLQVEFTRLFSAPGPQSIPTCQSVYTDSLDLEPSLADPTGCGLSFAGGRFEGYLGGGSCSEARRFYSATSFVPPNPAPAMADHVSTELAFLGYLCLMEGRSRKAGLEDEARAFGELRGLFYARFPGRWLQSFGEKLTTNTVSGFYRLIGHQLLM